MQFLEKEITEYAKMIWSSVLGIEIKPSNKPIELKDTQQPKVQIKINGKWNGTIILNFAPHLLKIAASKMFSVDAEETTNEEKNETLAELANMIGGNIKGLVPEPSSLSLPEVISSKIDQGSLPPKTLTQVCFESSGSEFGISILES